MDGMQDTLGAVRDTIAGEIVMAMDTTLGTMDGEADSAPHLITTEDGIIAGTEETIMAMEIMATIGDGMEIEDGMEIGLLAIMEIVEESNTKEAINIIEQQIVQDKE